MAPLYLLSAHRALRKILRDRGFDLVHAHWVVPNALVAAPLSEIAPVAVGLHGSDVFMAEKAVVRPFVARALATTSVLTGCSPELVDRVCALGFPVERSAVIPYGVDTEAFTPAVPSTSGWRSRLGIPSDATVMLSIGRMVTKKGYHHLMEIIPDLLERQPGTHLVLGGTGDRLDEFKSRCRDFSERVHFPGLVLRDTLPDLYREADLFVLPAVHDRKGNVDGLPNVILEAMASGLPIVASRISGIPLAVEDGVNGRLVAEGDPRALLSALESLLRNPEERRRMGAHSVERARGRHTWEVIAGRYRQAYLRHLPGLEEREKG